MFLALVSPSSPLNPPPSFLSLPRAKPIPQQPEAGARPGRVARGRRPEAGEQPQPQPVVDERRRTGRGRLEEARSEQEPGAQVRFLSPSSLCLVAVTVCSLEVVFRTFWSHSPHPPYFSRRRRKRKRSRRERGKDRSRSRSRSRH